MLGGMTNTYRRIMAVATGQLGLLSRQQANSVGVSNAQLRSRVTSGSLIQVGTDTFRLPDAPQRAMSELRALMLAVRVDFRFLGTPVVVEVLGNRFHRTKEQLRRDGERMNALLRDGLLPYQFSYDQVIGDPG